MQHHIALSISCKCLDVDLRLRFGLQLRHSAFVAVGKVTGNGS